jgi:hypothetical protein
MPASPSRERTRALIRERIARSRPDERQLRVLLVLAHEALGKDEVAAPLSESTSAVAAAPPVGADEYGQLVARVREIVNAVAPAGSRIAVVSRGDEDLLVPGFAATHFPQARGGGYAGFYPRESTDVIAHLEQARADGAEFLVLPSTGYWWVDYYGDFTRHLVVNFRVAHHDDSCMIFDLRRSGEEPRTA